MNELIQRLCITEAPLLSQNLGLYPYCNQPLCLFCSGFVEYSGTAPQPVPAGFRVPDRLLGRPGWDWQQDLDSWARKTQPVRHHEEDRHRYCVTQTVHIQYSTVTLINMYAKKANILYIPLVYVQETMYPSKWRWILDTLRCCQSAACWEPSMVGRTQSWDMATLFKVFSGSARALELYICTTTHQKLTRSIIACEILSSLSNTYHGPMRFCE